MIISTGLRNYILANGSFKQAMDGSVIRVYSGSVPASADDAIGAATLLVTISLNGTGSGVSFESTASSGVLSKLASEIWRGQVVNSGTATFFRMSESSDTGGYSTTIRRVQGTVGTINADYLVSNTNFVQNEQRQIDSFNVALPPT